MLWSLLKFVNNIGCVLNWSTQIQFTRTTCYSVIWPIHIYTFSAAFP